MQPNDREQRDTDPGVDLTPMLDVVFIMLIFFVVTATFFRESGLEVNRPGAQSVANTDDPGILISIDADDLIWIDGQNIDRRAVRANIARRHAEAPAGMTVIRADKHSTTDTLVQVLDAARAAGVYDVALADDSA